jgi:hypothetical protein
VGMNFSDPEVRHSDTVRMNTLQTLYPSARVWGVSVQNHPLGSVETPTWVHADVRARAFWATSGALSVRKTCVLIVDYRWCPSVYFEPTAIGLGYGSKWFSRNLPNFFCHGGMVCFLPNTPSVQLLRQTHLEKSYHVDTLSRFECSWNPLFRATDVATEQGVGPTGEPWSATVGALMAGVSNANALRELHRDNPFLLCYSSNFGSKKQALSALSTLMSHNLS